MLENSELARERSVLEHYLVDRHKGRIAEGETAVETVMRLLDGLPFKNTVEDLAQRHASTEPISRGPWTAEDSRILAAYIHRLEGMLPTLSMDRTRESCGRMQKVSLETTGRLESLMREI